jgi:ribonucleotide reductase alpha subunit
VRKRKTLSTLKQVALSTNEEYAKRFGINVSTAITLVKPSGTVSQMTDASSGVHPRFAPYYIRRIRISATDPLLRLMRDQGYPCYPEVGQNEENATTFVLEFPQKAPDNAICVKDVTALDQLKYWKKVKKYYVEHNPSVTIYVKPHEWLEVGNWIWKNWNYASGLSFLPYSEHVYQMAPYEEISSERYEQMVNSLPRIDFSKLIYYEYEDRTDVKRELACTGDKCEL